MSFRLATYRHGLTPPARLDLGGDPRATRRDFTIDWISGTGEIALHFNARPAQRAVVVNSWVGGEWAEECILEGLSFDTRERPFRIGFGITPRGFRIRVDGRRCCDFQHRISPTAIRAVDSTAFFWVLDPPRTLLERMRRQRRARIAPERPGYEPRRYFGALHVDAGDLDWLLDAWAEWSLRFVPFMGGTAPFADAPHLETDHVRDCRVLPNREALLTRLKKGAVCAEVGVLYGKFTARIWEVCEPAELHLFDRDFAPFRATHAVEPSEKIFLHEGDSSIELARCEQEFDWIYIDADHSYGGIKADVSAAKARLKHDGLLIFNDYIVWSHFEFLPYGVVRAVNELCREEWEMIFFCLHPQMHCDVALRRKGRR